MEEYDDPTDDPISVRDTGIGIPASQQYEAIFESFTQADGGINSRRFERDRPGADDLPSAGDA